MPIDIASICSHTAQSEVIIIVATSLIAGIVFGTIVGVILEKYYGIR